MNGPIRIEPVLTKQQMKAFVAFPHRLYKDCKQYVPDMDSDIADMFNPRQNPGLAFSDIQGFLAYEGEDVVGRVAAIINRRANETWQVSNVRFGMLDFTDNPAVSAALIAAVEQWGRERGMTHIQGPMGITDFDKEGMLVDDFDRVGGMVEIYNYPYYPHHMELLGFEKEVDWVQIRIKVPQEVPAKYARVSALSKEMFGLRLIKVSRREAMAEWGRRVLQLMNQAYSPLFGFSQMSQEQIDKFLHKYVPLLDMDMVPLILDEKGDLVCASITLSSLSHALQKAKGRLSHFGWFHILKSLKVKHEDTAQLLLIAVRPDMQGLGLPALVFDDLIPIYNKKGYKWAETAPQLETNVKELSQWKPLNPEYIKRRRCWRKAIAAQ